MPDAANTVAITINGVSHDVAQGQELIAAAESVGEYIPRFCYHSKLDPVGKCRMCLVEVEGPRGKALVPSCTVPVSDGMIVDTESAVVKKAQEGVLEFLLINHPLDCPICDKGGECPLQDQTMNWGPGESRFVEQKRTFKKPIDVSDIVLLDRERCVLCDRCVRVADDIAGDPLLTFIDRGNHVQIQTFPDEPFKSYFSGNTVQLCPVGALTSVDYRFKARPWDLNHTPSVSLVDSVQSTADVQTSRGKIIRVYGVENDAVNQGWLSDKDRFIFSAVHSDERVTVPKVRDGDGFRDATWGEALDIAAEKLGGYRGDEVASVGGANNTNEEAFVLGKFMRWVVGSGHIDAQIGDGVDPHLAAALTPRATINDLDSAATIFVWGPDIKETLPVLYLRIRKAVRSGAALVVASPAGTGLDGIATDVVRYRAGSGADVLRKLAAGDGEYAAVRELLDSGPVVGLVGRSSLAEDPALVEAVAAFARTLPEAKLSTLLARSNVYGALDMGLAPTLLPGRVSTTDSSHRQSLEDAWGALPEHTGKSTSEIFGALKAGDMKALLLVGSDPVRDCPAPPAARAALEGAEFVLAIDAFITDSSAYADVILPAAVWGEVDGTVTNLEGRVQRIRPSITPVGQARPLNAVLDDLAHRMGVELGAAKTGDVLNEIQAVAPVYAGVTLDYLTFEGDADGTVVPLEGAEQPLAHIPVDVGVRVITDRMTLHLAPSLYDDGVWNRHAETISSLGRTPAARIHPRDASVLAVADGDVVVISDTYQLPVIVDPEVAIGSVVIPFNQHGTVGLTATSSVSVDPVREGETEGDA
ncbi:MAG: NADH-quinone oxidoreductase subunit NuoG [Acidimicrobiia bacterium]